MPGPYLTLRQVRIGSGSPMLPRRTVAPVYRPARAATIAATEGVPMRCTVESRWARSALVACVLGSLVAMAPARAWADAAPPRDTSRFACPAQLPDPFTDISGSVHDRAIRCMARYGFINGTTSTTFSPGERVTRGQIASFLARHLAFSGYPLDTSGHGFTDIASSVHRDAVNALANLGIVEGATATTFAPNHPVTRAQAASLVARILDLTGSLVPGPDAFGDDDESIHEANIDALAAVGIVGGVTSDSYHPSADVSRGAAASILARLQDFSVDNGISFPVGDSDIMRAALTGPAEVPGPGDAGALASVDLVRTAIDGFLCLVWDIDVGVSSAPVAAHVHRGVAGEAGPIVLALPAPTTGPDGTTYEAGCAPDLDQSLVDAIFADPAGHYVNIHTDDFPDGAVRGQLSTIETPLGTLLSGDEEVPGPGEDAAGITALVDVLADGTTICSSVVYDGSGLPTAAHIHRAAAGAAGPIVVTLSPFDAGGIFADGCVGGLDPAVVADIAANPTGFYVNVHTDDHPDGAVRGQLEPSGLLGTHLSGPAEVPGPGDPDGAGEARFDFIGDGFMCFSLNVRGIATPTAAHIHEAAAGAAGPVVVTLTTPQFNSSSDCVLMDPTLFAEIVADPTGYYVNVHNADLPDGAIRGQLEPVP